MGCTLKTSKPQGKKKEWKFSQNQELNPSSCLSIIEIDQKTFQKNSKELNVQNLRASDKTNFQNSNPLSTRSCKPTNNEIRIETQKNIWNQNEVKELTKVYNSSLKKFMLVPLINTDVLRSSIFTQRIKYIEENKTAFTNQEIYEKVNQYWLKS